MATSSLPGSATAGTAGFAHKAHLLSIAHPLPETIQIGAGVLVDFRNFDCLQHQVRMPRTQYAAGSARILSHIKLQAPGE